MTQHTRRYILNRFQSSIINIAHHFITRKYNKTKVYLSLKAKQIIEFIHYCQTSNIKLAKLAVDIYIKLIPITHNVTKQQSKTYNTITTNTL